jgi:hypothetical protein
MLNSYLERKKKIMPLIEYYGMLFEWHDQKMELVYRGREITFDEVCSIFLILH